MYVVNAVTWNLKAWLRNDETVNAYTTHIKQSNSSNSVSWNKKLQNCKKVT